MLNLLICLSRIMAFDTFSYKPALSTFCLVAFHIFLLPQVDAKISWQACPNPPVQDITPYAFDCANITVPLDYTDSSSSETLTLELIRVPALEQPSKGSVLFNFGGPGDAGDTDLVRGAFFLMPATGNQYDLINVGPRATTFSPTPMFCSESLANASVFYFDNSDYSLGPIWAQSEILAQKCFDAEKNIGSYVGTASVARDFMSVVDALEEDGLLRYYGISYGTILGATIAAMFPEKIDKMMLDGVVNAHECGPQTTTDADQTFSTIFEYCIKAGPSNCTLSAMSQSASDLEGRVWDFIDSLVDAPITLNSTYYLSYAHMKNFIKTALYEPLQWPVLTEFFESMLNGTTGGHALELAIKLGAKDVVSMLDSIRINNPYLGIRCSDMIPRARSLEELVPAISAAQNVSRLMSGVWDTSLLPCALWPFEAVERYLGNFEVKTLNPIMLRSNSLDPVAPLVSAKNMSDTFSGSRLYVTDGFGHTSSRNPSACGLLISAAYFANRTLPDEGTICPLEAIPYTNTTWPKIVSSLGYPVPS